MQVSILDKQLLRSLTDEQIPFHEVMNAYGIRTSIANLPASVHAFVYVSRRGNYHLVMNGNINAETQYRVFVHEIKHIVFDLPTVGYIVGIDMQHSTIEIDAEKFVIAK
ncbi:hypothetical protein [Heliophilum fasciatum]|uniref:IrrE N-terminal-like domain-containing protein n=1 Tax=Heliophilum fasciatum TaxID=35700 RepID=A0A4V2SX39_9FIRM|nr:hypothetical protein [Heliophilum fasciatum]MCW2277771.1 hypothetical protein [Heliophilum fasciatum]TCP64736.1 hypothetical protein EDD73_10889 [Heliophilum fasciatum]